jgi:hypothetical protein
MHQEVSEAAEALSIKESYWLPLVKQWQGSNESSIAFCQRLNLNKDQFNYWRRKLISKQNLSSSKFVRLEVKSPQPIITSESLIVELPSRIKVTVPLNIDTKQLVNILGLLGINSWLN